MQISLKNIIVPRIPLAVILVTSCMILWIVAYIGGPASVIEPTTNLIIKNLQLYIIPRTIYSDLLSVSFTLLNAYLIAQINNRFTIIRTRTFLPIFIFLILMSSWDETHELNGSHFTLTFLILSLFYFLNMFRDTKSTEMAFMGSFFLGLSSLINNPLIFLVPVCWIGFSIFQSISLRTLLASVFGAITPWILYLSGLYLMQPDADFGHIFTTGFSLHPDFLILSVNRLIYLIAILVILIISIFGMYSITNGDAIRTRNNLNYLLLLLFSVLLIALFFENQLGVLLPTIAMLYAIIVSHPFTLKINNFYSILFIIFCVINISFVLSKLFLIQ